MHGTFFIKHQNDYEPTGFELKIMKYTYQCEDCFDNWESDHEEMVCPSCGSTLIFLEEKTEDEDLIDEFLLLLDEGENEDQ